MRRDRVTVIELAVVLGNRAAIFKLNTAAFHAVHFHQFAIGGAEIGILAIAGQKQLIPGSNINCLLLMNGKRARLCRGEGFLFAACIAGDDDS